MRQDGIIFHKLVLVKQALPSLFSNSSHENCDYLRELITGGRTSLKHLRTGRVERLLHLQDMLLHILLPLVCHTRIAHKRKAAKSLA